MEPSAASEKERVARYFDSHARDFDTIYEERKSWLRRARDRLTRSVVVKRLEFVREYAARHRPRSVLDVGCGSGRFAVALAASGARVIGLDFAPDMLSLAQARAQAAGVADRCRFVQADFLTWDPPEQFDLTLAIGVFDYVSEAGALLARMAAATRGDLIVSFPRKIHPLVPPRKIRLWASGCPVHFYGRGDMEKLCRAHLGSFQVSSLGRDYLVTGRVA